MRDEILYRARRVFADLREGFEEHSGAPGWWLEFPDEEELQGMHMSSREYEGAQSVLIDSGLAEHLGEGLQLTALGREACLYPDRLDEALGPPRGVEVNVVQVSAQTAVLGNNNTVQVNTEEFIRNLSDILSRDQSVKPQERSRWLDALKDISAHVGASCIKMVIDTLIKP